MNDEEIKALVEQAAKEGARQALRDIGLSDEEAYDDVKELRGLLDAWRDTKKTVGQTVTKMFTMALLTALAAGIWMNWWQGE